MKVVRVRLRFLRWTGRVFHRDGPVCAKARTPHDDNVSAWNVELSVIRRAKILASRESGCRVAHSRQVVRCHPMETLEHLDTDSETDAISDIQPVQNVTPNVHQASVILVRHQTHCVPRRLGLCWSRAPGLLSVSAASPSMDHKHGTVCQPILEHQIRLCALSSVISRHTCFSSSLRCCWLVAQHRLSGAVVTV